MLLIYSNNNCYRISYKNQEKRLIYFLGWGAIYESSNPDVRISPGKIEGRYLVKKILFYTFYKVPTFNFSRTDPDVRTRGLIKIPYPFSSDPSNYLHPIRDILNVLTFEGEYLNDKRNGKWREYDNVANLIFEGEYLNDKRNGKGKEYSCVGKLIFEGEYLNGVRNGKGKEYNYVGNLIFEGEYLKGY